MSTTCLNCTAPIAQNFCPNCGQKSTTHRYSIKHFIEHDFIHGVWHVDKGILYTIKELFIRPGHSVREFIQGKRVNYFSFVTLILLILTITTLITPYAHTDISVIMPKESQELMNSVQKWMAKYPKLVLIITIPLYSAFSYLWFKKAKLNFSEHLVLNAYRIIPELIVGLVMTAVTIFSPDSKMLVFLYVGIASTFGFVYSIWFYNQLFSGYNFSKAGLFFRSVLIPLSYMGLSFLIGIVSGIVRTLSI